MSQVIRRSGAILVSIDQPLRVEETEAIDALLVPLMQSGVPQLIIDLSRTPLIDGLGLEWLDQLDYRCGEAGGTVRLCGSNELCRDILHITGIDHRLEHFESLSKALASYA